MTKKQKTLATSYKNLCSLFQRLDEKGIINQNDHDALNIIFDAIGERDQENKELETIIYNLMTTLDCGGMLPLGEDDGTDEQIKKAMSIYEGSDK
jgi:hypothetical protein